jgi:hypothetical protein
MHAREMVPGDHAAAVGQEGVGSDYGAVETGVNLLSVGTACSAAALR